MRLHIVGCYSPYPPINGAGPGYLLEHDEVKVLIDCGSGVVSHLQKLCDFRQGELAAVVLSHLHTDHFCDLLVMRYAHFRTMAEGKAGALPVYAPDVPAAERDIIPFRDALSMHVISAHETLTIGGMRFSFYRTNHSIPCLAMRIEAAGRSLVYTADTAWDEGLIEFAANADVLLAEASFLERDKGENVPRHLSAKDCGKLAAQARAKTLILTHLWPEYNPADLGQEAASEYKGEIIVASMGLLKEV